MNALTDPVIWACLMPGLAVIVQLACSFVRGFRQR